MSSKDYKTVVWLDTRYGEFTVVLSYIHGEGFTVDKAYFEGTDVPVTKYLEDDALDLAWDEHLAGEE